MRSIGYRLGPKSLRPGWQVAGGVRGCTGGRQLVPSCDTLSARGAGGRGRKQTAKRPCTWHANCRVSGVQRGDNRHRTQQEERMDAYQSLRQQLRQRLAHLEGRLDTVEHDRRRDTNTLDPDWEEQATVRQNDEVLDELAEAERLQARAIRAALQRIEDGSYGQCVTCGEPIDPRRLEALPYATQCMACVRRTEHQGRAGR